MGYNQEGYDAECAALARALQVASLRNTIPERVIIFSDAQAAIRRMASDEPGPGQQYVIQARKHFTALRRVRPVISIEIRWCPAHKGIAGNEKADEWAKVAAEKPDTHGVEWQSYNTGPGRRYGDTPPPIPRKPQAGDLREEVGGSAPVGWGPDLQDEVPYAKDPEARWRGGRQHQETRLAVLPDQDRALPDRAVPQLDEEPTYPAMLVAPAPDADPGPPFQGVPREEAAAEDPVGGGEEADWEVEGPLECGTSWPMGGAAGRCWTSSRPRMWAGGCRWRRTTPSARCLSLRCGSGWTRREGGRGRWAMGGHHCSSPRPTSWRLQERCRGTNRSLVFSFLCLSRSLFFPLVRFTSSWDRPGRRAKRGAYNEPPLRGQRTGNGL